MVEKEVLSLLSTLYPNNKLNKDVAEFVYSAVEKLDENQEMIIRPIIIDIWEKENQ